MTQTNNEQQGKLQQAREILKSRGLKQQDYSYLTYKEILKLAGVK